MSSSWSPPTLRRSDEPTRGKDHGSLVDYDAEHDAELVLTLGAYLDHGGNYAESSSALTVHRSTLRYRLQRIREITGLDLGDADVRFNLQLACRAWQSLAALGGAPD